MAVKLTVGAIKRFMKSKGLGENSAVLQIKDATKEKHKDVDALILCLSDGKHWSNGFISKVDGYQKCLIKHLAKNIVIDVHSSAVTVWKKKNYIEILHFEILESSLSSEIGTPFELTTSDVAKSMLAILPLPISFIHEYMNNSPITIKGRLIFQSRKLEYSNDKGEGYYFVYHLVDDSKEIRMMQWNSPQLTDIYGESLKVLSIYVINDFKIKWLSKNWSTVDNKYELFSTDNTSFVRTEDDQNIPLFKFNFTELSKIEFNSNDGDILGYTHVIGVCVGALQAEEFPLSKGGSTEKRTIVLADEGGLSIRIDLWNNWALFDDFPYTNKVLALRAATVRENDYGRKYLVLSKGGYIHVTPGVEKTALLEKWYETNHNISGLRSISCPPILFDTFNGSSNAEITTSSKDVEIDCTQQQKNLDKSILVTEIDTELNDENELSYANNENAIDEFGDIEFDDWNGETDMT